MRLFVALVPPPEALRELAAAVAALPDAPGVRRAPPGQWHVTLAFLGEVAAPVLEALEPRLSRVAGRHAPLTLALAGSGRFGDRVLWTGVTGAAGAADDPVPAALRALAASVQAAGRRCGIPGLEPGRRYRPHLTLARGRVGADLATPVERLAGFSGSPWRAEALHLVRSELHAGPGGTARHSAYRTWPLTP